MLNRAKLNSFTLNQNFNYTTSIENVSFNWYGLFNSSILTLFVNRNYTAVEYNKSPIPQWDWDSFISSYNRWRIFEIDFAIKWNSRDIVDTLLDEMTTALSYKEWDFKFISSWVFRQIKATMTWINIKERTNVYIVWTLTFQTSEPFWYNINLEQTSITSQTTSPFTIQVNNTWLTSLPQIYLQFKASWNTGTTSISIAFNNRTITFTWSIANNDILLIDCLNKEVLLNNVLQDYDWTFSQLNQWVNSLVFTLNGTINLDVSILHRLNYLLP